MRFVLDNSVTMRWLFGDGSTGDQVYANQVLAVIAKANVVVPSAYLLRETIVYTLASRRLIFSLPDERIHF
ncbi:MULTISPECIES: hypothetical protein [unclassified Undibacterium]|uniref:hypothetical protein n=1 Tax=unclassified Undibacterium TaxID=2630295 RepID=UPI002AC95D30|nr:MULTISPECIES: hypothetical protein [unclassified Undibacterium]MEB0140189.1 hypothetical protein [Undibacterium sp. CCC2.1]MEB0172437.1 hypothetical protein [Undibacterium sp. CCC1.1]MEB0176955.1 hypothetical protein [Undibacterium sp. CCC3.4]MEB0215559.1 hypothetical protein [Undibacterium sp. 5I2]WPX43734.1 hypothetical protein RHM61_00395 [Undibacterium sp. CCC3.4]